jgi:hypothetical protein
MGLPPSLLGDVKKREMEDESMGVSLNWVGAFGVVIIILDSRYPLLFFMQMTDDMFIITL